MRGREAMRALCSFAGKFLLSPVDTNPRARNRRGSLKLALSEWRATRDRYFIALPAVLRDEYTGLCRCAPMNASADGLDLFLQQRLPSASQVACQIHGVV